MIPTWSDFAEVSAEVVPLSSYEKNLASQMQLEASHKMTIRYRPGITRDMRVLFRGRSHAIVGIKNPEELNQWLELQTHDRGAA